MLPPSPPAPPAIARIAGTHAPTGTAWVLLTIEGTRVPVIPAAPPVLLTAVCSLPPAHPPRFQLLVTDPASLTPDAPAFQPPWSPTPGVLFAPRLDKLFVTMDFLGYTRVKPVKRQWEHPDQTNGLLRYSTPGAASANMEEIAFYLQYLRALPTLRLTVPTGQAVKFDTTTLQQALHAEPLCKASGL